MASRPTNAWVLETDQPSLQDIRSIPGRRLSQRADQECTAARGDAARGHDDERPLVGIIDSKKPAIIQEAMCRVVFGVSNTCCGTLRLSRFVGSP